MLMKLKEPKFMTLEPKDIVRINNATYITDAIFYDHNGHISILELSTIVVDFDLTGLMEESIC